MIALCGLLAAALIAPAVLHAWDVWSTTEEFSFGFLVVPATLGMIWRARWQVRRAAGPGSAGGLAILVVALGLYLFAFRLGINALAGVAVPPMIWGLIVAVGGWRLGRVLAFPIFFLLFGLALYRGLLDSLGFALQRLTATGAAGFGALLGVAVTRDGLLLRSDDFTFLVAESCSGMSSLVSLLALASLWIYTVGGSVAARVAVMVSVLPLVMLANTARVTLVLLIASWFGQDAALGFFHTASGFVLFGLALGGMLGVSRVVGCRAPSLAS